MKKESRRLLSLNLALLVAISVCLPALPSAHAAETRSYQVNGDTYYASDSGKGWDYNATSGILTLTNYSGGPIDLTGWSGSGRFRIEGDCTVNGNGGIGINSNYVLDMTFAPNASLRVTGGDGCAAISAATGYLDISMPGSLVAIGGGVSALHSAQTDGVKLSVNEKTVLETGEDEQSLKGAASYGGEACLSVSCNQVQLIYNAGTDGAFAAGAKTEDWISYGESVRLNFPQVVQTGYLATHWYATPLGGTYYDGAEYTPSILKTTFTAKWKALPASYVILEGNGTKVGTGSRQALQMTDSAVTLPAASTAQDGVTVLGWSTQSAFTIPDDGVVTDLYWPGETVTGLLSGSTLYAVYAVGAWHTYDGNGGLMGGEKSKAAVRAEEIPAVAALFTKEGCYGLNWNTKADGSGTVFTAGNDASALGSSVLYAQWTTLSGPLVVYHGNGGTAGSKETITACAEDADLSDQGFSRSDKAFLGWSRVKDGETLLTKLPTLSGQEVLELYAVWGGYLVTCSRLKIQIAENGYSYVKDTLTFPVAPKSELTLPAQETANNSPIVRFDGWNTMEDASGTWYHEGETLTVNSDMTLYGQYIYLKTATDDYLYVTDGYYANHNFCVLEPDEDGYVQLPAALTKYDLRGWTVENSADYYYGTAAIPGARVQASGKLFQAVCVQDTRTYDPHCYVVYDGNGGETLRGQQTVFFAVSPDNLAPLDKYLDAYYYLYSAQRSPLVRKGYRLTGWSTDPKGEGQTYAPGAPFSAYGTADTFGYCLYAQWEPTKNFQVFVPDNMRTLNATLYLALYDDRGQLLDLASGYRYSNFELELPAGADSYKLMAIRSSGPPAAPCIEEKLTS